MQDTANMKIRIQPSRYFLVALALVLFAALSVKAGDAQAARVHPLEVSETFASGGTPSAVAVNSTTHHFYVVAEGGNSTPRVYNLDEGGQLDLAHPELTGASFAHPYSVAVDNSGGENAGYIYVVYRPSSVQQFDPEGEATTVTITESAIPANGTPQAGGLPPVVDNGSFEPREVAVDGSGDVFVTDDSARAIDVFTPAGVFVRQIASALSAGFLNGITIGGSDIYVALSVGEQKDGALESGLSELDAATGKCVSVGCAAIDPAPITGVAVDEAAGKIFTTGQVNPDAPVEGGKVTEYEAATGGLLGVTRPGALHLPRGISVDETSHKVIVADELPRGEATVKIFGSERTLPDVVTEAPEVVTDHSATLRGEIGAAGVAGATCVFQYVGQEEFDHGFEGAAEASCVPGGPFSGEAMNAVHADVTGLRGGTTYHERILGTNSEGSDPGEDVTFTTAGPTVTGTEAVGITNESATLKGTVDPNKPATTYRFQYLTQAAFEAGGWAGASEVPSGGASLGAGIEATPVSETISGLVPGTTYRFRILAVSADGTTEGQEVEFTAQQSSSPGLPDDRAYEQASPTQKNGANVQGAINSVQASLDGERITFFSNAGIPGGEGAQDFPTFMASRAFMGWSTRGLLPPASYGPRGEVMGWTEDLTETYDFASAPFEEGELLRGAGAAVPSLRWERPPPRPTPSPTPDPRRAARWPCWKAGRVA